MYDFFAAMPMNFSVHVSASSDEGSPIFQSQLPFYKFLRLILSPLLLIMTCTGHSLMNLSNYNKENDNIFNS